MPSWGEILHEIQQSAAAHGGQVDLDGVRHKYLSQLRALTKRDVIVYYTKWIGGDAPAGSKISITLEDMQGMMEVCRGLPGPSLDIILHSPGGSPEATASIVRYLRQKFTDIRVFVPLAAMSAATMWALASNVIVMGKHSQLGPIDPQMVTPQGQYPARAIIKQFEQAKDECAKDPSKLTAWYPILLTYGPSLIQQCLSAETLALSLAEEWLREYMFHGEADAATKAKTIAVYFANYDQHQSHGLGIGREQAKAIQVKIEDLETDQQLQDAVLSVHHATLLTMGSGTAVKIVENHLKRAYIQQHAPLAVQQIPIQAPPPAQEPGDPFTSPQPRPGVSPQVQGPPLSSLPRGERRRQQKLRQK